MSLDLFDFAEGKFQAEDPKTGPLAHRIRPLTLGEFKGQEKLLGPGKPLRLWIETDRVPSLLFWGPPGSGKTTLASLIAKNTRSAFEVTSAAISGLKEVKEAISRAQFRWNEKRQKSVLFVDEIHRFNKSQQDALLPYVEDGTVTLIGATTENPSFEINRALLSRLRVVRFEELGVEALEQILIRALNDPERGLGGLMQLSPDAIRWLANLACGDARKALTLLENLGSSVASLSHFSFEKPLETEQVKACLSSAIDHEPVAYDKSGEEHYNVVSAFIKSIRDSDPHAGLYYLARMLEGGEDPVFIARRLTILASEDIGNADPRALLMAIAAKEAVTFIGMPEARICLAQAVTYLALAPKSNASYLGIEAALEEVRKTGSLAVPFHLRNAPTAFMRDQGYGRHYSYAHNRPDARARQTHLPDPLIGRKFYSPSESGYEKQLRDRLDLLNPDFELKK